MVDVKRIAELLEESKYTVSISGVGMSAENGYAVLRDGEESYEIEQEYGYSFEEIFHSRFFTTHPEEFYRFYRSYMLSQLDIPPGEGYASLAELERMGLMQMTLTKRVFGLPKRAGCKHVIDIYGTILQHYCPRCGTEYSLEYVRNSKGVAYCTQCNTAIRPRAHFYGEMIDNKTMTNASEEIMKTDVLLVLGTNLGTDICKRFVKFYEGSKIVLINEEKHYTDKYADYIIYGRVDEILPEITAELRSRRG